MVLIYVCVFAMEILSLWYIIETAEIKSTLRLTDQAAAPDGLADIPGLFSP